MKIRGLKDNDGCFYFELTHDDGRKAYAGFGPKTLLEPYTPMQMLQAAARELARACALFDEPEPLADPEPNGITEVITG